MADKTGGTAAPVKTETDSKNVTSSKCGRNEDLGTALPASWGDSTYEVDALRSVEDKERALAFAAEGYRRLEHAGNSVFRKYKAAIHEMRVRLEILDDELDFRYNRNPIHNIEWRLKKPQSVFEKLNRYGKPLTLESMEENILDIAGIRVICSYVDDVYNLVKMLDTQEDLEVLKVKDYIAHPKPNGYRSLHVIVKVPIFFLDEKAYVPVEIQLRTIAMDFWASLEHSLKYKRHRDYPGIDMFDELKNCSDIIEDVEGRMQILMHAIEDSDADREEKEALRANRIRKSNGFHQQ